MGLTEINLREKKFHDELHSKNESRKENIFYKAISTMFLDFETYIEKNCKNKKILDYGCGVGSITEKIFKKNPLEITGIDISKVSIEKAKDSAKKSNFNIKYIVDNCEKTNLDSNSFDLIYGAGILHHLNLKSCVVEINRLLKNEGKMIFMEPLGTNPLINLYRKMTPLSRSSDEHPFLKEDFDLLKNTFLNVEVKYYGFLTLLFFPFYRKPEKSFFFKILDSIDRNLFKLKFFRIFAWSVIIVCNKN